MIKNRRLLFTALAALALVARAADAVEPLATALEKCWKAAVDQPAEALGVVDSILADAAQVASGDAGTVAELRLCRGYIYEQLGDVEQAAAAYQATVEDGERLGTPKLLAVALALRGEAAHYRGAFTAALEDLDRAYRLELETGRVARQTYILNAIANVYADSRVGAYDRAIEYYRLVLAVAIAAGDSRGLATNHFNLGSTYERKGDLGAALGEFEQAVALDRTRGDLDEVAANERALAQVLVKLGRGREALPLLDAAVARFTFTGDLEAASRVLLTRGIARHAVGDFDGALVDLDAAGARFRQNRNDRFLVKVEEERAEALASRGDHLAAFRARTVQVELERRLATASRDEQTSRLRVQFDSEKKEQENRALVRENDLRSQALRDGERIRSLQGTVLALAAILLGLLVVLVLRQAQLARRLRRLAMTDELTGLANRRSVLAVADEQLAATRRSGAPLSVLTFDIDHFKRVNDGHGHAAGDRTLQRVALAARSALRGGDVIGRIGGEEFLVLLPGTELGAAAEVAERLRASVARLDNAEPHGIVTVSVGVAVRQPTEVVVETLVRRADVALYRAKALGRNRVEIAPL